ncbi:MAG: GNAT family N-acetyltransferase [Paraglaciecola sp.]|nr:GNAT family N-acetyltransferase [Paraglaciecola sp.]
MNEIQFKPLCDVDLNELSNILNKQKIRIHLIQHDQFNAESINAWVNEKIRVDQQPGCRVRAVFIDEKLAGWCGIQPDGDSYEVAIVIDDQYWGTGLTIFKQVMQWATEFGLERVMIHLLETRKNYKFLNKMAVKKITTHMLGHDFVTYILAV